MRTDKHRGTRGAALVTVLVIVTSVSAMLGVAISAGMQRTLMARRLSDRIRAKAIAEAGVSYAYAVLTTNWGARAEADLFPPSDYSGGRYELSVIPIGEMGAVISATGHYGTATQEAILDAADFGIDTGGTAPGPALALTWIV